MGTAAKNSPPLFFLLLSVISLASCRKDSQGVNQPPVADAGKNDTIALNMEATLDGSASYDPDGRIVNYLWEKFTAPGDFMIQDPTAAVTKLSGLNKPGEYRFKLTVTDNRGASASAIKLERVENYLVDANAIIFNNLQWEFDNRKNTAYLNSPDMPAGHPVSAIKKVYLSSTYPGLPSWYPLAKDGTTAGTFYYKLENNKVVAYIFYDIYYDYTVWLVQYFGDQLKVEF